LSVYDDDENGKKELIGEVNTTLGNIAGSKNFQFTTQLIDPKNPSDTKRGEVTIKVVQMKETKAEIELKLACRGLPVAPNCFCLDGNIRPYILISRGILSGGSYDFKPIYQTEASSANSPDPSFAVLKLSAQILCNGNYQQPIRFEVFNVVEGRDPEIIGRVDRSIDDLSDKRDYELLNPLTRLAAGRLIFEDKKIHDQPTFMGYLKDGWNMQVSMAIDYTNSNKPQILPDSLHYINGGINQYQMAIQTIGSILECYDSDKKVAVYGFGGVPYFMQ
jgi:hypothetical protein